jgi:hypothetical protein
MLIYVGGPSHGFTNFLVDWASHFTMIPKVTRLGCLHAQWNGVLQVFGSATLIYINISPLTGHKHQIISNHLNNCQVMKPSNSSKLNPTNYQKLLTHSETDHPASCISIAFWSDILLLNIFDVSVTSPNKVFLKWEILSNLFLMHASNP